MAEAMLSRRERGKFREKKKTRIWTNKRTKELIWFWKFRVAKVDFYKWKWLMNFFALNTSDLLLVSFLFLHLFAFQFVLFSSYTSFHMPSSLCSFIESEITFLIIWVNLFWCCFACSYHLLTFSQIGFCLIEVLV